MSGIKDFAMKVGVVVVALWVAQLVPNPASFFKKG